MEVHHSHGSKKKITEYLLECLMIFVAVSMGFIAENIREHYIEHEREKKFIRSLVSDLQTDITALKRANKNRDMRFPVLDSAMLLFHQNKAKENAAYLYYANSHIVRLGPALFTPSEVAVNQLKNGGNLRLIRNNDISDSIQAYDVAIKSYMLIREREGELLFPYREIAKKIFDGFYMNEIQDSNNTIIMPSYNPPIQLNNKDVLECKYYLHVLKVQNSALKRSNTGLLRRAENLLHLIQKEYHLEN